VNALSSIRTASLLALTLAGSLAATTAPTIAPKPALPSPSLIPLRVGASVSFHYDANENGPSGAGGTHAVVTLTRIVNDRLAITISPDEGQASAVIARVQSDGSFRFDGTDSRRPQATYGAERAGDPNLPMDGPIGGLPGGAGAAGQGRGQYPSQGQGPSRVASRVEIPAGVRVLSALVAARSSASMGSWPFSVTLGSGDPGVAMIAKLEKTAGSEATVVADGTGEIRIAAAATAATQPSYPQTGTGGYGRGRRGGQGQGIPGQGGSGQSGSGRSGSGQGGSGQGAPGQGGYGQGGYAAPQAPQTVPATATLHIESTFRGGRLQLARGSETMVVHGGSASGDTTTSVRWTLTAL
jgi:hypothetical protein